MGMRDPLTVGSATLYFYPSLIAVHYWLDDNTYTHCKFDDFDDAMDFAERHSQ